MILVIWQHLLYDSDLKKNKNMLNQLKDVEQGYLNKYHSLNDYVFEAFIYFHVLYLFVNSYFIHAYGERYKISCLKGKLSHLH